LHAGTPGLTCPCNRVVQVGVEVIDVPLVVLVADALAVLHPLMPGGQRIDAPVDEQPEAVVDKPSGVTGGGLWQSGHDLSLLLRVASLASPPLTVALSPEERQRPPTRLGRYVLRT